MEFFRIHRTIPFMRHALALNIVSFVTFAAALFFIITHGFHLSIEFTGGREIQVSTAQAAPVDSFRDAISKLGYKDFQVQNFGTSHDVMIRLPVEHEQSASEDQGNKIMAALTTVDPSVHLRQSSISGPQFSDEQMHGSLMALLFVVVGIILYLAMRFEWKFAVAGVLANLHDVVIILGFFAFFQWEFSLSVLAGVLAVLGYSVNESVVIMDRIRENFRKSRQSDVKEVINGAITQTTSRTIITHACTQMMVLSMLFFGGPALHGFAMALTIGIWFGIYSSVFVAAALAMWMGVKREDFIKPIKKDEPEVA